jgi:sodium transport system ATP-binding protein
MIRVEALHKYFGDVKAVQGISFEAHNGKITGLLGPNGAGKSTTLRVLYTVLKPDSGSATIDGVDVVNDSLAARAKIGTLPHGSGLYPHLTARENIAYYAKLYDMPKDTIDDAIQKVIDQLDINENIILDEPSNGLDVMATRSLRELIRQLKRAGKCVLFSSHVMQEVAALCDEIVIIAEGQVALHDTADGIRNVTGCEDLEDAFVKAIAMVEPAS